ncbi:hypothetical protein [Micromonospora sp. ATCC 39149]|nr:hypothetical protein [Micromonospora sp. ATCC 39149]
MTSPLTAATSRSCRWRACTTHVAPYGEVKLNMTKQLALRGDVPDR